MFPPQNFDLNLIFPILTLTIQILAQYLTKFRGLVVDHLKKEGQG